MRGRDLGRGSRRLGVCVVPRVSDALVAAAEVVARAGLIVTRAIVAGVIEASRRAVLGRLRRMLRAVVIADEVDARGADWL